MGDMRQVVEALLEATATPGAPRIRQGQITAVAADGTATVTIAGSTVEIPGVKVAAGCCPIAGTTCWILTDGRDLFILDALAPTGPAFCAVRRTTAQTIATATTTTIDLGASPGELTDPYGLYDGATDRIVIDTPGLYTVTAGLGWAQATSGYRDLYIRNGSSLIAVSRETTPGSTAGHITTASWVGPLAQGDTIDIQARQTSGGNLDTVAAPYSMRLAVAWLGPSG